MTAILVIPIGISAFQSVTSGISSAEAMTKEVQSPADSSDTEKQSSDTDSEDSDTADTESEESSETDSEDSDTAETSDTETSESVATVTEEMSNPPSDIVPNNQTTNLTETSPINDTNTTMAKHNQAETLGSKITKKAQNTDENVLSKVG